PILRDRGIDATLIARPPLAALMGELQVPVIRAEGQMRIPVTDGWSMLGSLPHRLGVTLDQLPGATPYLRAPADRRAAWAPRIGAGVRIGVVARGNPQHANDANRSLPPEAASFLHALPGAISLIPGDSPLPISDFADTAAVIERLDLVITVDTATAHLAGAMGRPCWVLLPAVGTDWRWMRERTDSRWYPSIRLFRQAQPGNWAEVLRAVATNLQAYFQPGPAGAPRG
ncbi:MAG: putative repeat protein, partial [Phenylobacterium sp.]|nr:putative repeat protein [Phenylobacterium sp.]